MLNKAKQAYRASTKALTKPIPFWLSPLGILVIAVLVWVISLIAEPFILADRPTDIADIAGTRLWLLDKAIYILTIFAAAYWAQHILHTNTMKRESILSKLEGGIELSREIAALIDLTGKLKSNESHSQAIKLCKQVDKELRTLLIKSNTYRIPPKNVNQVYIVNYCLKNLLHGLRELDAVWEHGTILQEEFERRPSVKSIIAHKPQDPETQELLNSINNNFCYVEQFLDQLFISYNTLPSKLLPKH